jgi:hypothetical protein
MVKCKICGEEARYVLTINTLYGKSHPKLEIYLCEYCAEHLEEEIKEIIKELKDE